MTPQTKACLAVIAMMLLIIIGSVLWSKADLASSVVPHRQPEPKVLSASDLKGSIFVGLAVLPGDETAAARTIYSAMAGAKTPQLVCVGVVRYVDGAESPLDAYFSNIITQYERVCAEHRGSKSYAANIRVHTMPYGVSRGRSAARHALETHLYASETYFCHTVPGLTFTKHWDVVALQSLHMLNNPKAILTTEPSYAEACSRPTYPKVHMACHGRLPLPATVPTSFATLEPSRPFETLLWVPHWSFFKAQPCVRDVPSDPSYRRSDDIDQLITSARLFTHGYTFHTPLRAVACWADSISTDEPRPVPEPSTKKSHLMRALVLLHEDPCAACGRSRHQHKSAALGHEFEASHKGNAPQPPYLLGNVHALETFKHRCGGAWVGSRSIQTHVAKGYVSNTPRQDELIAKGEDYDI